MINSITGLTLDSVVDFTARHYILLPSYMHTLNLVRWNALFRNNHAYNKDLYFSALAQITALKKDHRNLPKQAKQLCPAQEDLLGYFKRKKSARKLKTTNRVDKANLVKRLFDPIEDTFHDPFLVQD